MKKCRDCKSYNKKFIYGCMRRDNCHTKELEHYTPKWYIRFLKGRSK